MKCEIELFEEYDNINFYSVRFDGQTELEIEKFFLKFPSGSKYDRDFNKITEWINKIAEKGSLYRYFRPEGKYEDGVSAIPIEVNNKIRLYCVRITDEILIFGNGGVKNVRRWQDDPELKKFAEDLIKLKQKIDRRIKREKIFINGKEISGNLIFDL